jgi:bifunctional non-homologous end joining protein LigD
MFVKKLRNGFVPHTREQVYRAIEGLRIDNCPFANLPEESDRRAAISAADMKNYVWVRPQVWCKVEFAEWTAGGRLRHAAFRQLITTAKTGNREHRTEKTGNREQEAHKRRRRSAK